jgi:hypothetical protein
MSPDIREHKGSLPNAHKRRRHETLVEIPEQFFWAENIDKEHNSDWYYKATYKNY